MAFRKYRTIELADGRSFTPVRTYRLRGGYRLLVTADFRVWQEFDDRYTMLATFQNWRTSQPCITRQNACRAANFFGHDTLPGVMQDAGSRRLVHGGK